MTKYRAIYLMGFDRSLHNFRGRTIRSVPKTQGIARDSEQGGSSDLNRGGSRQKQDARHGRLGGCLLLEGATRAANGRRWAVSFCCDLHGICTVDREGMGCDLHGICTVDWEAMCCDLHGTAW